MVHDMDKEQDLLLMCPFMTRSKMERQKENETVYDATNETTRYQETILASEDSTTCICSYPAIRTRALF
jgi:hypothetical protein